MHTSSSAVSLFTSFPTALPSFATLAFSLTAIAARDSCFVVSCSMPQHQKPIPKFSTGNPVTKLLLEIHSNSVLSVARAECFSSKPWFPYGSYAPTNDGSDLNPHLKRVFTRREINFAPEPPAPSIDDRSNHRSRSVSNHKSLSANSLQKTHRNSKLLAFTSHISTYPLQLHRYSPATP